MTVIIDAAFPGFANIPQDLVASVLTPEQFTTMTAVTTRLRDTLQSAYSDVDRLPLNDTQALLVWNLSMSQAGLIHYRAYSRLLKLPQIPADDLDPQVVKQLWQVDLYRSGVFHAEYRRRLAQSNDPMFRAVILNAVITGSEAGVKRWRDLRNRAVALLLDNGKTATELAKDLNVTRHAVERMGAAASQRTIGIPPLHGSLPPALDPGPEQQAGQIPLDVLRAAMPDDLVMTLVMRAKAVQDAAAEADAAVDAHVLHLSPAQEYLSLYVLSEQAALIHYGVMKRLAKVPQMHDQHQDPALALRLFETDRERVNWFYDAAMLRMCQYDDPGYLVTVTQMFVAWIERWIDEMRDGRGAAVEQAVTSGVPLKDIAATLGMSRQAVLNVRRKAAAAQT